MLQVGGDALVAEGVAAGGDEWVCNDLHTYGALQLSQQQPRRHNLLPARRARATRGTARDLCLHAGLRQRAAVRLAPAGTHTRGMLCGCKALPSSDGQNTLVDIYVVTTQWRVHSLRKASACLCCCRLYCGTCVVRGGHMQMNKAGTADC